MKKEVILVSIDEDIRTFLNETIQSKANTSWIYLSEAVLKWFITHSCRASSDALGEFEKVFKIQVTMSPPEIEETIILRFEEIKGNPEDRHNEENWYKLKLIEVGEKKIFPPSDPDEILFYKRQIYDE